MWKRGVGLVACFLRVVCSEGGGGSEAAAETGLQQRPSQCFWLAQGGLEGPRAEGTRRPRGRGSWVLRRMGQVVLGEGPLSFPPERGRRPECAQAGRALGGTPSRALVSAAAVTVPLRRAGGRWQAGGSHLLPHVGGATARGLKARGSAVPDPRLPGRRRLVASRGCQSTVDYETPSCHLLT